jgi:hypothetical protein
MRISSWFEQIVLVFIVLNLFGGEKRMRLERQAMYGLYSVDGILCNTLASLGTHGYHIHVFLPLLVHVYMSYIYKKIKCTYRQGFK